MKYLTSVTIKGVELTIHLDENFSETVRSKTQEILSVSVTSGDILNLLSDSDKFDLLDALTKDIYIPPFKEVRTHSSQPVS